MAIRDNWDHLKIDPTVIANAPQYTAFPTETFDVSNVSISPVQISGNVWSSGTITTITTNPARGPAVRRRVRSARTQRRPRKPRRSKMALVIVPAVSIPKGHPCGICGKKARPGQRAFFQQIYATKTTTLIVVFHERCMKPLIDQPAKVIGSPSEREYHTNLEYNRIRDNIERDDLFT